MNISLSITQRTPKCYGLTYLALIPAYSAIYYFCPEILNEEKSPLGCLYFSIITITTLGYGDITPVGWAGQVATASEALFGVILIGLFLNSVANARGDAVRAEQEEKENRSLIRSQRARLNGHYRFIQPAIEKYKLSVIDIIRPGGKPLEPYDQNFRLNDMKDMYQSTLLMNASRLSPAIEGYFEIADRLRKETIDLIKNVDLRHFPEIEKLCLELASILEKYDRSKEILSALRLKLGKIPMTEHIRDSLRDYSGDHQPLTGANILNGYILLYHQIKLLMELLPRLQTEVNKEINDSK